MLVLKNTGLLGSVLPNLPYKERFWPTKEDLAGPSEKKPIERLYGKRFEGEMCSPTLHVENLYDVFCRTLLVITGKSSLFHSSPFTMSSDHQMASMIRQHHVPGRGRSTCFVRRHEAQKP